MISCHQGTSAGCANGVNVVVLQHDAAIGQSVNVRSRNLVGAMKTDIIPALERNRKEHVHGVNHGFFKPLNGGYTCQVICNNEDYVRWRLRSFRSAQIGKSQKY